MTTNETRDAKDRENKREREDEPGSDHAPASVGDPLGPILESFLTRFRQGKRPSLSEYAGRYPALADQIRELFPALVEIEQLGSVVGAAERAGSRSATAASDRAAGPGPALGERPGVWPQWLGDYRILGRVGEGGMGVVYEAVRESLRSRVAAQGHARTLPRQRRLPAAVP